MTKNGRTLTDAEMPQHQIHADKGPEWRRFGRQRRMLLMYSSDDSGSALPFLSPKKLTERSPIEKYYAVGEEVLVAFQAAYEQSQSSSNLDEAYTLGNVLMKFLSKTVCAHPQYTSSLPGHIKLRQRSLKIRELLRSGLHQISECIDDQEFERAKKRGTYANESSAKQSEDDTPTVSITLSDDAEHNPDDLFARSSEEDYEGRNAPSTVRKEASNQHLCSGYPIQAEKLEVKTKVESVLPLSKQTQETNVALKQAPESDPYGGISTQKPSINFKELISHWPQRDSKTFQVEDMTRRIPNHKWAPFAPIVGFPPDGISDVSDEGSSYMCTGAGKGKENHVPHSNVLVDDKLCNRVPRAASSASENSSTSTTCNQDDPLALLETTQKRLAESEAKRKELQSEVGLLREKLYGRVNLQGLNTCTAESPPMKPPQEIIIAWPSKNSSVPSTGDFGEI